MISNILLLLAYIVAQSFRPKVSLMALRAFATRLSINTIIEGCAVHVKVLRNAR